MRTDLALHEVSIMSLSRTLSKIHLASYPMGCGFCTFAEQVYFSCRDHIEGIHHESGPMSVPFSFVCDFVKFIDSRPTVDATISFKSGLTVSWSGKPIGTLKMGDVKLTGDVGATIAMDSSFAVSDVAHLTDFTKVGVSLALFGLRKYSEVFCRLSLRKNRSIGSSRERT